jgi:hypothetical protein
MQDLIGNQKGISTVWQVDAIGHYYPLDIQEERYATMTFKGQTENRMVYHLAVAAALAGNQRIYDELFLPKRYHFKELQKAFEIMGLHNSEINQRWEAMRIYRERTELSR